MSVRHPAHLHNRCRAYATVMKPAHVFSHTTAAALYGIPLPAYALREDVLEVSAPNPLRRPRGLGILGHEVAESIWRTTELVLHSPPDGDLFVLPVVTPALLFAQLATLLDPRDLVAVGDAIVTLPHPSREMSGTIGNLAALREVVLESAGRRGSVALANAVELVRAGPLSRPETLTRLMMAEAGMPHPEINVVVEDSAGSPIAMADLVLRQWKTVVEYDGDGHRSSRGKYRSDIDRYGRFADAGWSAHRVHADHVFGDPNEILGRIGNSLCANGWRRPRRGLKRVAPARR